MHLPTLPHCFAPDGGRVTDKQHDTRQDTQKAGGELQGRARRNEHTEDRRQDRTRHGDGETEGDTRQPRNTRQAGADRQKKEYVIFKGGKERENTAETRKSVQVCAYTFYPISRRGGRLLHFLLYIRGILYIFIYILSRLMFTFLLKLKVLDIFIII